MCAALVSTAGSDLLAREPAAPSQLASVTHTTSSANAECGDDEKPEGLVLRLMTMSSDRSAGRSKAGTAGLFIGTSALAGVVVAAMILPAAASAGVSAKSAVTAYDSLPAEITAPPLPLKSVVRAADGTDIATLYSQNRVEVPLNLIATDMQHAIIAIEDSRFYDHNGVDLKGTLRAAANNVAGEEVQGASTLTMQYVKNLLVVLADTPEQQQAATARSAGRKLQEIRYAVALEQELSKPQILNNYLNISYFGAGAYGVETASQRYFSKPASQLTLVEAATLAGIVQSPTENDPTLNPDAATKRRNLVLKRMLELGYISQAEYDEAKATPLADYLNPTAPENGCAVSEYPFFCDYAIREIKSNPIFGATPEAREQYLATGGLVINTTLNIEAQDAAEEAVVDAIPIDDPSGKAASIAMVQPGTGNIEAMGQNRLWGTEGDGYTTFNYAVDQVDGGTIGMQAGSTFKIFTIANALEKGINPYQSINATDNLYFPAGDWGCPDKDFASFVGENSTQSGKFDMWQATAYSTNTYFLQREKDSGLCDVVKMAERAGIHTATGDPLEPNISFTLGTTEVSPLTVANSYATFAAHGLACEPRSITTVVDRNQNTLEVPPVCTQTIPADVADATTAILTGVVDGDISGRTGQAMSIGRETTGKTGTTDSSAAVWYAGYTPNLAAAVWVGDPRGGFEYPMRNVTINGRYYSSVFGSSIPGPIWRQAMRGALANVDEETFKLNSKYDLKPVTQGGGPNPSLAPVVDAYNEYLATGQYVLKSSSSTSDNNNTSSGRIIRPDFGGDTPTFTEFTAYYYSNGGSRQSATARPSASPFTQDFTNPNDGGFQTDQNFTDPNGTG